MPKVNWKYLIVALVVFLVEIYIALFEQGWVRGFLGDALVVVLIYCAIKSFYDTPVVATSLAVLGFAFVVEFAQYFKLLDLLGWSDSGLARIVIGNTFHWLDLLSYVVGIGVVVGVEYTFRKHDHQE